MTRFRPAWAASWLLVASVSAVAADDRPDALPYRPTVSTPAALTAPGWLEGEFGGLVTDDRAANGAHRTSVPYALKYAFTEDYGFRVAGEAFVAGTAADGTRAVGFGDTELIAKRRFAVDAVSAFGLEAGVVVPTARRGLGFGSGKPDWLVTGVYSADFAGWHGDLNLQATRIGAPATGQSRVQELGALALSRPVADRLTVGVEWSGTRQRGVAGTAQLLAALSWAARRDLVFDIGGARGLNRSTPWQAFTGVTVVIGRID